MYPESPNVSNGMRLANGQSVECFRIRIRTLTDIDTSVGQHYVALPLADDCPMLIYIFDRIDERNTSAFPIDDQ